jgi:uncharacterized protein YndB with AHSA1/START domain
MTSSNNAALSQWALDREIVLSRVIDARRDVVFSAWTDPKHLPSWFGPTGFKIETKEIDICVGGLWRFDMIAPVAALHKSDEIPSYRTTDSDRVRSRSGQR